MRYLIQGLLLSLTLMSTAEAGKKIVECRVIVGGMRECNPYSTKLLKAKEITYEQNKKRLIVEKTLPVPTKKPHMKVISVEDMIERYVKVEPSKRYVGTQEHYPEVIKPAQKTPKVEQEEKRAKEAVVAAVDHNKTELIQPTVISPEGTYSVQKGDTLSRIAMMFGMKSAKIMRQNGLKKKDTLRIGQKITLPFPQDMIDAIASAHYKVKELDTLISIAKKFDLSPKDLARYNKIKNSAQIRTGKLLKLPLPYILAEEKVRKKAQRKKQRRAYGSKLIRGFGKHRLRVTATAYTSHGSQTDKTPFLAAWNNRLRPGMKVIAVSRDLLYKYGMRNGTKVKIAGLPGYYRVRDKMNKRYKRRIDIYMGLNRRKALRWGRRSVVIYW